MKHLDIGFRKYFVVRSVEIGGRILDLLINIDSGSVLHLGELNPVVKALPSDSDGALIVSRIIMDYADEHSAVLHDYTVYQLTQDI